MKCTNSEFSSWQLSTTTSSVKLVDDFEPEDDVRVTN